MLVRTITAATKAKTSLFFDIVCMKLSSLIVILEIDPVAAFYNELPQLVIKHIK